MKLWLALLLLLTSCSPAQPSGDPVGGGEILPEAAQRALDAYTATARGMATAAAQATATRQARLEATADGWTATAVEQAYQVEQGQATDRARETEAAATATVEARATAGQATSAWAVATVEAVATAQAESELARERRADEAESWAEWREALRWIVLVAVIAGVVLGLGAMGWQAWYRIEAERIRARAEIARDALSLYLPNYYGAWDEKRGGMVVQALPAPVDGSSRVIENGERVETRPDVEHSWRMAYKQFVWAGDRYGFGVRDMGPAGAQVVSDEGWRKLTAGLVEMGVLTKRGGTRWAEGWGMQRFREGFGGMDLPYYDGLPPDVVLPGLTQAVREMG